MAISLSATLLAAQKAGGKALWKVVFTKSGEATRTYGVDTTNRIPEGFPIVYQRDDWLQTAEVTVDNREGNLTALNLIGYQAIISFGYNTSSGDEYQGTSVMKCIAQRLHSGEGDLRVTFSLAGRANQMEEDKASAAYEPTSDNTDTVKIIVTAILGATMPCFSHTEAFTLTWELTAGQESDLANVLKPADFLRVHKGQSRLEVLKNVLQYTGLDGRFEGDGALHIFQTFARVWPADTSLDLNEIYKQTTPSDWAASTAYSLNDRVKPVTENGYYYVCSSAGTSGGTEPTWPTKDGDTVVDSGATWTCRDISYVFTVTTAGATGSSEPVWTYAKDDTISDGSVTWTLQYDYDYDDVSTGHNYWRKGIRQRLVVPNKITVASPPGAETVFSGSATYEPSFGQLPLEDFVYLTLVSDAEAADIALAMIDRAARNAETGNGFSMLNIGAEVHDYILTTDSWEGDAVRGRIRSITCYAGPGIFKMTFAFGSAQALNPLGADITIKGALALLSPSQLPEPVPQWGIDLWNKLKEFDIFYANKVFELEADITDLQATIAQMQISVPDWDVTRIMRIPVRDENGKLG